MNKPCGVAGVIEGLNFPDLNESHIINQFEIEIANDQITIGYDDAALEDGAKKVAKTFIDSWAFRNDQKTSIRFNRTWRTLEQNPTLEVVASEDVNVTERVQNTVTNSVMFQISGIVENNFDSASFANDIELIEKAISTSALGEVLEYYNKDILNSDHQLSGIYKALEAVINDLKEQYGDEDGYALLGSISGTSKAYVEQVMDTTHFERHHEPQQRVENRLSNAECVVRAKKLIQAYINDLN